MEDKLGKVLIVDDDVHINELIDMYLKSGGYITKSVLMEMMLAI